MQPIFLLCGVPGSGKTWIAQQLTERFRFVAHDAYDSRGEDYPRALLRAAEMSERPVLGEAPFKMSLLINWLRREGAEVHPYFVVESPVTTQGRYEMREGRPIPKQHLTRIARVRERAAEFGGTMGTSTEILAALRLF